MRLVTGLVALSVAALLLACAAPPEPAASGPTPPANVRTARVARVVDGDTVDVLFHPAEGRRPTRVRLIGLNTPESVDPRRPVQCFGKEASARAKALLEGRTVGLEMDPSQGEQDRNGRMLAYVWMEDGRLFNWLMIYEGYGFEYTYGLPYKYQDAFKRAQRDAKEQSRGLWASSTCGGSVSSRDVSGYRAAVRRSAEALPPR